jgi:putative ABC transport system substrate-binding protein
VKRRDFILLLAGAMIAARALRAQQKAMPVIGWLGAASPGPVAKFTAAFRQGLSEMGFVEGQNIGGSTAGPRAIMIGCPYWPPTSSAAVST